MKLDSACVAIPFQSLDFLIIPTFLLNAKLARTEKTRYLAGPIFGRVKHCASKEKLLC